MAFRRRRLDFVRYAYVFADGIHVSVRLGSDKRLCLLVIIGVCEDGRKELLAVEDGYRESSDCWAEVLRDLIARGMSEPKLVIGTARSGCGPRCQTCSRTPASSAAGFTRPRT